MFNQKVIISIISLFFLASCETATQDALKGAAGKVGSAGSAGVTVIRCTAVSNTAMVATMAMAAHHQGVTRRGQDSADK